MLQSKGRRRRKGSDRVLSFQRTDCAALMCQANFEIYRTSVKKFFGIPSNKLNVNWFPMFNSSLVTTNQKMIANMKTVWS